MMTAPRRRSSTPEFKLGQRTKWIFLAHDCLLGQYIEAPPDIYRIRAHQTRCQVNPLAQLRDLLARRRPVARLRDIV
jgi:hypothetical protein